MSPNEYKPVAPWIEDMFAEKPAVPAVVESAGVVPAPEAPAPVVAPAAPVVVEPSAPVVVPVVEEKK